jgi:hypothetical protein
MKKFKTTKTQKVGTGAAQTHEDAFCSQRIPPGMPRVNSA